MKKMIISKLKKEKKDYGCDLVSTIFRDDKTPFELRFEYNIENMELIDDFYADSFLVSLLPYAMEFGYDIQVSNPISKELFNNLEEEYIPCLAKYNKNFKKIDIKYSDIVEKKIYNNTAIATGCSCGVDSLHAIYTNLMNKNNEKLTHLVVVNSGACSWKGGEESKKWFEIEIERAKKVAMELNLKLIYVNTNLMEFYEVNHEHSGFMRISGIVLGLDNIIGKYYYASSYEISKFNVSANDDGYYLYMITKNLSDSNLKFLISGLYEDRYDKVKLIKNYEIAHKYLNVCWNGGNNCGRCEKCLRTIGSLYSLDALDAFTDVLNTKWFERHKIIGIGRMISFSYVHKEMYTFLPDIKKKHHISYMCAQIYCYVYYNPKRLIRGLIRKLYYIIKKK